MRKGEDGNRDQELVQKHSSLGGTPTCCPVWPNRHSIPLVISSEEKGEEMYLQKISSKSNYMPKITNEKKLEAVKEWLSKNGILYFENYKSGFGVTIDLKIPSLMIAVFLSDDNKEEETEKCNAAKGHWPLRWTYRPFFIRESEAKGFVLEKLQNCCYERMVYMQRKWEKSQK